MVGALSIVRYRTAVKDPLDTGFIFWAIMAGIMAGIGLYLIAIISSLLLGVLFMVIFGVEIKRAVQYLLIVRYEASAHDSVIAALKKLPKQSLRNKHLVGNTVELTLDVQLAAGQDHLIDPIKAVRGVESVNLVSYQQDYGL
jgi:uncharacterized membrane protein YhiD involved in acid resistance